MTVRARGFTLIEIMVVVVILAILGTLVAPQILGRIDEARVTKARNDLRLYESALDLYRMDNFHYPTTEQGLDALRRVRGMEDYLDTAEKERLKDMQALRDRVADLYAVLTPAQQTLADQHFARMGREMREHMGHGMGHPGPMGAGGPDMPR